jgi:hypothetical protein
LFSYSFPSPSSSSFILHVLFLLLPLFPKPFPSPSFNSFFFHVLFLLLFSNSFPSPCFSSFSLFLSTNSETITHALPWAAAHVYRLPVDQHVKISRWQLRFNPNDNETWKFRQKAFPSSRSSPFNTHLTCVKLHPCSGLP